MGTYLSAKNGPRGLYFVRPFNNKPFVSLYIWGLEETLEKEKMKNHYT